MTVDSLAVGGRDTDATALDGAQALLMLNNSQIDTLVSAPKRITDRTPADGYRLEHGSRRCDLELESIDEPRQRFAVFARQNVEFMENCRLV